MALARRLGGRAAAARHRASTWRSRPRFLTVFSLNCVGQYVDVLALGGLALALLARAARRGPARAPTARLDYLAHRPAARGGVLAAAGGARLRRRGGGGPGARGARPGATPGRCSCPRGSSLGVAARAALERCRTGGRRRDILGREPAELRAQADALPRQARRALQISFPILAGLSPGHPWADAPGRRRRVAMVADPGRARGVPAPARPRPRGRGLRRAGASSGLLPPLLLACCLAPVLGRRLRARVLAAALPAAGAGGHARSTWASRWPGSGRGARPAAARRARRGCWR